MNQYQRSNNAKNFAKKWSGTDYKEKGNVGKFWIGLLHHVFGINDAEDMIQREVSVPNMKHSTDFIDVYIPSTRVLIEQKAPYIRLNQHEQRSFGWVTPYEQAKKYDDNLPLNKKAKWIVTCNFHWFYIYDMNASGTHPRPTTLRLQDLWRYYYQLDFLIDSTRQDIKKETKVSVKACNIINSIYHQLLGQYDNPDDPKVLRDVNKICVRLVFCLYADDSGIFGHHEMFHDYMEKIPCQYWNVMLGRLFKVLDTPEDKRHQDRLDEDIAKFPYVDGGMFADTSDEHVHIPNFDASIADLVLNAGDNFDWSQISPTIFGALFESTLNPQERHTNGMHYTSVQNIHKVIDPLFLNKLRHELNVIKTKYRTDNAIHQHAKAFQNKLASLTFLDPACGSGNFLTETYLCLRKLENEAIKLELGNNGQIQTRLDLGQHIIKVSIKQFYGIEINDFAVSVAKTAMWIAESQMAKETQDIIQQHITFLPLTTNSHIKEANALEINWADVIKPENLNYIISNPPFVGKTKTKKQRIDMKNVLKGFKGVRQLDYVTAWYKKSSDLMLVNHNIKVALVSTNSITEGIQVSHLWSPLLKHNIHISYAYRSFKWVNSTKHEAQVYCIIIGLVYGDPPIKLLFNSNGISRRVNNINPYLYDLPNVMVSSRIKPLCNVPEMDYGNKPTDGGYLSKFSKNQVNKIITKYPSSRRYFKRLVGAREFLHNKYRWCLWLNTDDTRWQNIKPIKEAVIKVESYRKKSTKKATRENPYPYLFEFISQPESNYLLIPRHTSGKRKYVPIGYMNKHTIINDSCFLVPKANLYLFGIMNSRLHNLWIALVSGRLKNDFRYSAKVTYNNFPWPNITIDQKYKISQVAQDILDARQNHKGESLAELYNPLAMPPDLQEAHRKNDKAVLQAYGLSNKASKNEIITKLLKMYAKLVK